LLKHETNTGRHNEIDERQHQYHRRNSNNSFALSRRKRKR
jgi:hypothetical protein